MKKGLFVVISMMAGTIFAQNVATPSAKSKAYSPPNQIFSQENQGQYIPYKSTSAVSIVNIGKASNCYSTLGTRTYLDADPSLNTITFTHRVDIGLFPSLTSGNLCYDVSKDGGQSWANDQGPIFTPTGSQGEARYPQGVIFNPTGNTVADSAYLAFFASSLNGTNATSTASGNWGGQVVGSVQLDNSDMYSNEFSTDPSNGIFFEVNSDLVAVNNTQKVFGLNRSDDLTVKQDTIIYRDTLIISEGTFDQATRKITYTNSKVRFEAGADSTTGLPQMVGPKIEFSPDGTTGYIAALVYPDDPNISNYGVFYPAFIKSTDGGATWSSRQVVNLSDIMIAGTSTSVIDSIRGIATSTWTISDVTTAFECDMTVDKNNNPHIIVDVAPSSNNTIVPNSASSPTPFAILSFFDLMLDVYSNDGGTTWQAHVIGSGQTFRGHYPDETTDDFSEDNRPQIARTADGSVLIYAYGDTDTSSWGISNNIFPDVWMRSLDVDADTMGTLRNMNDDLQTKGTANFFNLSRTVFDADVNGDLLVPVTATKFANDDRTQYLNSVQYIYYPFMYNPSENTSLKELKENTGNIAAIYPNPASDQVTISYSVKIAEDFNITVTNITGGIVKKMDLGRTGPGNHLQVLDIANLPKGVYIITLSNGISSNSKRLIVD